MARKSADGGAGAGFAAGVGDFSAEKCAQSRLDEGPCAHVFRLFLAPDELGVFWKWLEHFAQLLFGQWIKLFDANDCRVINLALDAVAQQIVVNFA